MLVAFPLLIIPVAIYNMIAFLTPPDGGWASRLATLHLVSGTDWTITFSDALIGLALLLLLFEIVKAVRPGGKSVIDHLLSVLVFIGLIVEFLMVEKAATSTFAILCAISLVDAVAGIVISVRLHRRAGSAEVIASPPVPPSEVPHAMPPPVAADPIRAPEPPRPIQPPEPPHPIQPPEPPPPKRQELNTVPEISRPGPVSSTP